MYTLKSNPYHVSYQECLDSVSSNGLTIRFVPETRLTYELCLAAVKNNPVSIHYVPSELLSVEMAEHIISPHDRVQQCLIYLNQDNTPHNIQLWLDIIPIHKDVYSNIKSPTPEMTKAYLFFWEM